MLEKEKHEHCCCHHYHEENKHCSYHKHDETCCNHNHHDHHEHEHNCGCGCSHDHGGHHFIFLLIRAVISILFIIIATFLNGIEQDIILCAAYFIIAYDVLYSAIKGIIKGKAFDENFLMSIASLTALIVPFFTNKAHIDPYDGILVIILYQIGEFIQHAAVDRSKKSITEMLELDVDKVIIIDNKEQKEINVEEIKVDDIIIVKPGDLVVVDGIIIEGNSSLNTAALTGESLPKDVFVGDEVLSGSINNDGLIYLKAKTTIHNSTTTKVKEIIEKANKNKAHIDSFFTRFAKVYTPVVIAISLFVMFILPLFFGFNEYFLTFLYKGLAIMVISCPCALVISIPLSFFLGIGKAARNKILVKGASYLEILSNCNAILFDKTGTLTKGEFVINNTVSSDITLMNNLLYSCEKNFTHAIAKSITNSLKEIASEVVVTDLINIPGYGLKAKYQEKNVLIGNKKLMVENDITIDENDNIETTIYVGYDGKLLGYILIEDELKNDAAKTIDELLKEFDLYIISGDKHESVELVSERLGIEMFYSELLPNQKSLVLEAIKEDDNVIYVGDGINDAACLISATVGIGMKSIGSDVAIEASDIVLMDDDLYSIPKAIKISKKTKRIVIQNIIFSLTVKFLVMLMAIILSVPMYLAIIADVGVALIAILNSLRILYGKLE